MASPCLTCSHYSDLYSSVTFSCWELGTCSQVACKACVFWPWLAPGFVLNKPPFAVAVQPHQAPFSAWNAPFCQSLAWNTRLSFSLSHPLLILLGWTRVLSWGMSSWTVYSTPVWIQCHYWMFSRYHIRLLRGVHQTWNIPFVRGSTWTETTHPGWAPS